MSFFKQCHISCAERYMVLERLRSHFDMGDGISSSTCLRVFFHPQLLLLLVSTLKLPNLFPLVFPSIVYANAQFLFLHVNALPRLCLLRRVVLVICALFVLIRPVLPLCCTKVCPTPSFPVLASSDQGIFLLMSLTKTPCPFGPNTNCCILLDVAVMSSCGSHSHSVPFIPLKS